MTDERLQLYRELRREYMREKYHERNANPANRDKYNAYMRDYMRNRRNKERDAKRGEST